MNPKVCLLWKFFSMVDIIPLANDFALIFSDTTKDFINLADLLLVFEIDWCVEVRHISNSY